MAILLQKEGVEMTNIEREFTYLITELPEDIKHIPSRIIEDNYIPKNSEHPTIRIRRNGNKYTITKKYPEDSKDGGITGDSSKQVEHTIPLTKEEYEVMNKIDGKRVKKRRFAYKIDEKLAEIDVFLDDLEGLALVDFEFDTDVEMEQFRKPEFAGEDVTQELIVAGGLLAGKNYAEISRELFKKYNYNPITVIEKHREEIK